jgi:hypothetical protein
MEAECFSETSVYFERNTRCYIPADTSLRHIYSFVFKHPVALMYLFVYIYICLKYNLLSCPTSLSLDVSTAYGHHQFRMSLAKIVPLYVEIKYRV